MTEEPSLSRKDARAQFIPRFDGPLTLDELLRVAGCPLDTAAVAARFQLALDAGRPRSDVIPELFEGEPRFPDPSLARRLYENLFGLWDMVESGEPWTETRPARAPKPPPPEPVRPFGETPDAAWVEVAWRTLDGLDERSLERLEHAFENRQDALVSFLDEGQLSDTAYAQVRTLLFELWAMLDAGWPEGLRGVTQAQLENPPEESAPQALLAYAEEALFEAGQDEAQPLSVEELASARRVVGAGLAALWHARKVRAQS